VAGEGDAELGPVPDGARDLDAAVVAFATAAWNGCAGGGGG
jgi:hypothetical protein